MFWDTSAGLNWQYGTSVPSSNTTQSSIAGWDWRDVSRGLNSYTGTTLHTPRYPQHLAAHAPRRCTRGRVCYDPNSAPPAFGPCAPPKKKHSLPAAVYLGKPGPETTRTWRSVDCTSRLVYMLTITRSSDMFVPHVGFMLIKVIFNPNTGVLSFHLHRTTT